MSCLKLEANVTSISAGFPKIGNFRSLGGHKLQKGSNGGHNSKLIFWSR